MRKYFVLGSALALITSTAYADLDESGFFDLGIPGKVAGKPLTSQGDESEGFAMIGKPAPVLQAASRQTGVAQSGEDDDFVLMGDSSKEDNPLAASFYVRGVKNLSQPAYGNQMAPGRLAVEIESVLKFNDRKKWTPSRTTYFNGISSAQPIYQVRQEKNRSKIIVTAPAHDLGKEVNDFAKAVAGNLSIKEALEAVIRENPQGKLTVTVPVAQSNSYMMGMMKRNHWTNATFEIENGKVVNSNLYDSKGLLSALYGGGNYVQQQVASLQSGKKTVQVNYLGHQGLFNNNDCGRFAAGYIEAQTNGQKPTALSTGQATGLFGRLWRR